MVEIITTDGVIFITDKDTVLTIDVDITETISNIICVRIYTTVNIFRINVHCNAEQQSVIIKRCSDFAEDICSGAKNFVLLDLTEDEEDTVSQSFPCKIIEVFNEAKI